MANSTNPLFDATPSISLEEQAELARKLIAANELYKISNSMQYEPSEREEARQQSSVLTNNVLEQMPGNASALNLMARIKLDEGLLEEAALLIDDAQSLLPNDVSTLLNKAYVTIAKRQYKAAEGILLAVLDMDSTSVQAFSGIALCKLKQGEYLSAFSHYRKLIELGVDSPNIRQGFMDAASFLSCDYYQKDLEPLLVHAFSYLDQDPQKLGTFTSSILTHKYDLTNDNAVLDLEQLLQDQLLLKAINYCTLPSLAVEGLIVAIRQSILAEVIANQQLRDELIPFAIAVGLYSSRVDYALFTQPEEEQQIKLLTDEIKYRTEGNWETDDLVGALISLSMYEPLYTQKFSFQLLREDLEAWPLGIQNLLSENLYELANEHQAYIDMFGQTEERLLRNELKRATDRWNDGPALSKTNIYHALEKELGSKSVPIRFRSDEIKVLIVGGGSGERACRLREGFENVSIYSVDSNRDNLAYAHSKAQARDLYDIQFIYATYECALISDEQFDIIEFGEDLNHVENPLAIIREWQSLLREDGLLRFSFDTKRAQEARGVITQLVQDRRLSPTIDNVRHLRHAISQDARASLCGDLTNDMRFYSGEGCKELFFHKYNHYFDLQSLDSLIESADLEFIGFVDLPNELKQKLNPLTPSNLKSWHVMDQDNCLFKRAYQLYCRRK